MKTKSVRRIDKQGRVILPSHIRKALNLTTDSAVNIELTEDGILVRPNGERCCVCGCELTETEYTTIETWNGPRMICGVCSAEIIEEATA